jgi:iron complex transport system ATP-binding protein
MLMAGAPAKVAFWTTRALERAGFQVLQTPTAVPVQIEIMSRDEAVRWRSTMKDQTQDHLSIDSLIRYLQTEHLVRSHDSRCF